jgi:hypothetical protein
MVFGYYCSHPKALTLSHGADPVPHLLLDTGREIFSFQCSSVGMPDLMLCVRDVPSQSVITILKPKWFSDIIIAILKPSP